MATMRLPDIADNDHDIRHLGGRPLSDADYRMVIDSVSDYAIFMLDPNGIVRSWNEGARQLKGYAAPEVIGRHFSMFYPQELNDRNWAEHELREATRSGRFEDEGWRLRKDGTRFWANIVITRLDGPGGTVRGFAKITRDLTERRKQEELLRHSEERFRMLVESVQDYAVFMLDPSGHVVSWNAGAEKNTGYQAEDIIGRHFSMFYPEETSKEVWENELHTALSSGRYTDEGWRVRKDGTRFWAGVVLTAIFDDQKRHRGFAKVTRDLTQSQRINALQDESRRIIQFLAMLGHELRNPLSPIANSLTLLRRERIEPAAAQAAYGVMERQLKQMTRLVDDLLDVSRITYGKIRLEAKPVRLQDAALIALEAVQPQVAARRHQLKVKMAPQDVWVNGDKARIAQIITNLLGNAAKFTPEGGRIDFELRGGMGAAEIMVKDNGPGIPEGMRDTIFDLFVQGGQDAARSSGGLGLGLSLTRQLCILHGGSVEAYSKGVPGEGSEFRVLLPTVAAPVTQDKAVGDAERRRILIVDDNRDSADSMSLLLESEGYQTAVAYDGNAALEEATRFKPHVMLLDIGLPGMTGLDVARRLRTEMLQPPEIVAVTGYGQESDREASFKAGFYAHITKPVDFEKLMSLVRRIEAS